jgi:hypothetical protein
MGPLKLLHPSGKQRQSALPLPLGTIVMKVNIRARATAANGHLQSMQRGREESRYPGIGLRGMRKGGRRNGFPQYGCMSLREDWRSDTAAVGKK